MVSVSPGFGYVEPSPGEIVSMMSSPGGGASLAPRRVTVMVTGWPAMGWLKSKRAVLPSTSMLATTAFIGPLGPCSDSCVPGTEPPGSLSSGISANFSSSRAPKPASPARGMALVSPTAMPTTPASRPGRTSPLPTWKPRRPLPSDSSSTSPVLSLVSLNSTSTSMPGSTLSPSAPPRACAATLRRLTAAAPGADRCSPPTAAARVATKDCAGSAGPTAVCSSRTAATARTAEVQSARRRYNIAGAPGFKRGTGRRLG
mmetsp:Transcript_27694/g.70074  ORF Transcript_27694/g.70074 Transcript_27694/m.70074 type:complete len:258 (+) Transcript_27694:368-1141(+)